MEAINKNNENEQVRRSFIPVIRRHKGELTDVQLITVKAYDEQYLLWLAALKQFREASGITNGSSPADKQLVALINASTEVGYLEGIAAAQGLLKWDLTIAVHALHKQAKANPFMAISEKK